MMKLRAWLTKNKIADAEFARRIKKHPATVLHLTAGTRRPSLDTIEDIARETGNEVNEHDWVRKAGPRKAKENPSKPRVAA